MRYPDRRIASLLLAATLLVAACSSAAAGEGEETSGQGPATIEPIEGSDLARVILTADAVERLDLLTAPVGDARGQYSTIPYAAVFYGLTGETWTYTNPEPLVFVRAPIVVDRFEGEVALLSDGPPAGTLVVTQGVAELFGAETGVDA